MKWNNTFVAGVGAYVPSSVTTSSAVDQGLYSEESREADGFEGASIERELVPPQMAVEAAGKAVTDAGIDSNDIDIVFHSGIWFQGVDMWPAASYVAAHAARPGARAFDLQQQCNVGLSGLELAATLLPSVNGHILLTTADRFDGGPVDRWRTESGVVYGDGAGAVVLSSTGGKFELVSTHTEAANDLEKVVRGPQFATCPSTTTIDIGARFDYFISTGGMRAAAGRLVDAVTTSVGRALADAESEIGDMTRVIVPAVGKTKLDWQLQALIPVDINRTNWRFARQMGHLGAGDQFVGLERMCAEGGLEPGDRILLVGGGAGFTCTSAVLEFRG
ncbi:ketoacyl-ACP synthase III family protein [Rhodococcus pyridinivorans]